METKKEFFFLVPILNSAFFFVFTVLTVINPFRPFWNHVVYFVFVANSFIMLVEQCNQHRNMHHENSHKTVTKKILLFKYFRMKLIKTDKIFIAQNVFSTHPRTVYLYLKITRAPKGLATLKIAFKTREHFLNMANNAQQRLALYAELRNACYAAKIVII